MSADLERVIRLVFQGDNQTAAAFRSISSDMKKMGDAVEGATQPLANMHDRILKLQAGMGALAVGGMAASIHAASEFDTGFREIASLLTDVDADLDSFSQDILAYASRSTFAFDETQTAVYEAISRYADYTDALNFVALSEKLAIAGKADLVDATKLLASTMQAYGAEVEESERYTDVFLKTVQLGGTTLQEVAAVLGRATPLAGELGIEIEDLGAVIATLTAGGMETSQAITGLIGIMNAVIKPSSQATAAAEDLEIAFSGAALRSEGLADFLGKVFDAAEGNDKVITSLFGRIEGLTSALALFGKDGGDAFVKTLDQMREAGGTTEQMYQVMVEGIEKQNAKLFNSIRGMLVRVGQELIGTQFDIVGSVTDIFIALQEAVNKDVFKDVFDIVNGFGADLVALLNDIARELPEALADVDFTPFAEGVDRIVRSVSQLFQRLFGDVDIGTAEGLTSVIQQMVNVFTTLNNVTEGIVKAWGPWFDLLAKAVEKSTSLNESQEQAIGTFLGVGKAVNVLAGGLGSLGSIMGSVDLLIKAFLAQRAFKLLTAITQAASGLVSVQLAVAGILGYAFGSYLRRLIPGIDEVTQAVYRWVDSLFKLSSAMPARAREAQGLDNAVKSWIDNIKHFDDQLGDLREELQRLGVDVDGMSREMVLEVAHEKGILDAERLFQIVKTRKAEAEADPVKIDFDAQVEAMAVGLDTSQAEHDLDTVVKKISEEKPEVPIAINVADIEAQSREAVAQIEATADIVRDNLKWKAELDIAEVQANADILESVFNSISTTIESTGDTMLGLFGLLADADLSIKGALEEQIRRERDMREEAHDKQMMLIDAQLEIMRLRARAMDRGEAMISIDGQGLQPHLEAFMWEVLAAIQVRVNEEGMDMLLGVS